MLSGDIKAGQERLVNLKKTAVANLTYYSESDDQDSEIKLKANKRSKLLVYSGVPIKEEIVARGPFVMNSMEEIQQAFCDYQ